MKRNDRKKLAPVAATVLIILYVGSAMGLTLVAALGDAGAEVAAAPIALLLLLCGAVIGGVLVAMRQRLREIDGGEEESAKKY